MTQAKINPAILRWARNRLQLTEEEVAKKVGLKEKPERVRAWEQGECLPTFRQAQKLARVLRIPFGYLFLSQPPLTTLPIADFRTLPKVQRGKFSPELEDVLNDALRKRDWLRERRMQEGAAPLPFVGRFPAQTSPRILCKDIRTTLDLSIPTAKDARSWTEHLRILVRQAEKAGIIVLQSGYVGSNTHRALSVKEFRGFALADPYAPLIFLNAKDAVNGRIFTLAHELGHLWTGTSGISNPEATLLEKTGVSHALSPLAIERLCNQVAAELLVPAQIFEERWQVRDYQELAKEFRVSTLVILIRGYEMGLLPAQEFQTLYAETVQKNAARENKTRSSGGDYYRTFQTRNGHLLLNEVAQALREGTLLYTEASWLLNAGPKTLEKALQTF